MSRLLWAGFVIAIVGTTSVAAALTLPDRVPPNWFAALSGGQEVPAVATNAWGSARLHA